MKRTNIILSSIEPNLSHFLVEESPGSLILTAKKQIYIPGRKIVLTSQATEQEARILNYTCNYKGGIIV